MWEKIARFVLKNKIALLIGLFAATAFMGWHASKVQLSYEFSKAIPTDNPKYVNYQNFRKQFGEDGNMLVIGIQTPNLFSQKIFPDYKSMTDELKTIKGVENVLSIPSAVLLLKDSVSEKLKASQIFEHVNAANLDSLKDLFLRLPFYRNLLYNPQTNAYVVAIRINKDILNSKNRTGVVNQIIATATTFSEKHSIEMHYSGLPLIPEKASEPPHCRPSLRWLMDSGVREVLLTVSSQPSTTLAARSAVFPGSLMAYADHLERERHVLRHRLVRQQLVVLEDVADGFCHKVAPAHIAFTINRKRGLARLTPAV